MSVNKRIPSSFALAVCGAFLASCGGGGSDVATPVAGNLSGSVTLQASAEVAVPASITATLPAGASGQPVCVLNSGQLPPNMTLTACSLQGTPTTIGSYVSQLTMTIPGYTGSTRVDATVSIGGPELGPSAAPTGSGLRVGSPVTGLSIFGWTATPPFSVKPTDTWTYRIVSGSLPPGLSFDTSTGLISGTPTQSGSFPLTVGATLTRGTVIYQLRDYVTNGVLVLSSS